MTFPKDGNTRNMVFGGRTKAAGLIWRSLCPDWNSEDSGSPLGSDDKTSLTASEPELLITSKDLTIDRRPSKINSPKMSIFKSSNSKYS